MKYQTIHYDKKTRFVDLVINDYTLLSEKENLVLPDNILDFKDSKYSENVLSFYKDENFKINQFVCLLHGIKSSYDNIISDDIDSFSNIKIEIVNNIEDKLKSQLLKFSKTNNFFNFLNTKIKQNQKYFENTQSFLENSFDKIEDLINENNYVNVIQNSFIIERDNISFESSYFGKIFNTSKIEKENSILINKNNISSKQIDSQQVNLNFLNTSTSIDENKSIVSKNFGIDFKDSMSPFMSLNHVYSSNSFVSQLLVNNSFSLYGLYPTQLLNEDINNLQKLKDKYPNVIINYYNNTENPFLDISTNSKSFNNKKYYQNEIQYIPYHKVISLNNITYINNEEKASDFIENIANNYSFFTKVFYKDNVNPTDNLILMFVIYNNLQNASTDTVSELAIENISYLSKLSILTPNRRSIEGSWAYADPSYYDVSSVKYLTNKNSDFYNNNANETGLRYYNFISSSNVFSQLILDIQDNKISNISRFIRYLNDDAYAYFINNLSYEENNDFFFNKINNTTVNAYYEVESDQYNIDAIGHYISSNIEIFVEQTFDLYRTDEDNPSGSRVLRSSPNEVTLIKIPNNSILSFFGFKDLKKLDVFLSKYKNGEFSTSEKVRFFNNSVSKINFYYPRSRSGVDAADDRIRIITRKLEIRYIMFNSSSAVNTATYLNSTDSFTDQVKIKIVDDLIFEYLNQYYHSLFYFSHNFNNLKTNIFNVILNTIINYYNNETQKEEIFQILNVNPDITFDDFSEVVEFFTLSDDERFNQSESIFKKDIINSDGFLSDQEFVNNPRLNNFIDVIDSTKELNFKTGYFYYTKSVNDSFKNNNLTNKPLVWFNELEDLYKNSNYSSYKLAFYVDELVKKIKLYRLEKESIDYNIFKSLTEKLSKFDEDITQIPIFSSKEDKNLGLLSEDENVFNLLLSKLDDSYYSNLDFTEIKNLKNMNIKNTLHRLEKNIPANTDFKILIEDMLKMLSNYYYNNSINMSSNLIKKITTEIKEPEIESSVNEEALPFLYFSNFEVNEKNTSFEAKNEIVKRFIKKAISFRNNANNNLKNSNLGYEFITSTADFDALSSFNKEIIDKESDESENFAGSNIAFYDYSVEINDYFVDLFKTNEQYNIIRNAIFNNNSNFDLQYDFYYIPIESINTQSKKFNGHVCFNKFRDSHQDFEANMTDDEFDVNLDEESFGFLFDVYVFCFPNIMLKKKNIPFKIPTKFKKSKTVNNKSFNNKTLVKNYIKFDTNINSKKAAAFITYNIKNERNEFATLVRKKIFDNFDELCQKEKTVFNYIIKKINVILEAVSNVKDVNFEEVSDIDDFIDNNKFIIGLISNLITIYSEIYNKNYREKQNNTFFNAINNFESNGLIEEYDFNSFESTTVKEISAEIVPLQKSNGGSENPASVIFQSNVDNNIYLKSNDNIIHKNFIKLRKSDYLQSITFDLIVGYFKKSFEFEKNRLEIQSNLFDNEISSLTNTLNISNENFLNKTNIFSLNSLSKEISNSFYKVKNTYKDLIKNQNNNEDVKNYYSNNIDKIFKNYSKVMMENFKTDNFSLLKTNNLKKTKILTFGLKNSMIKNMSYNQYLKIIITIENSALGKKKNLEFLFSPILTNIKGFYNDNISFDREIGIFDIYKKSLNERFVISDIDGAKNYLKKLLNISNDNQNTNTLIDRIVNSHINSNILDKILNIYFDFNLSTNDFNSTFKQRYSDVELLNQVNKLSAFNFNNIFMYDKTSFDNIIEINNNDNIVLLPNFIETLESKSLVFEFMNEINKIYSNEEFKKAFDDKEFYDFYNIPVPTNNDLDLIEIEYSIEDIA